jgi:hypothetical protein
VVVPREDLLPFASKLDVPCFTIIEEPLINKKRMKDNDNSNGKKKEKTTEVASKIMRMSPINLMWNVTEGRLQSLNKKFKQSDAVNIRKYRGGANEKLNAVSSPKRRDTGGLSNGGITSDLNSSIEKYGLYSSAENAQAGVDPLMRGSINNSNMSAMISFQANLD